ncbi:MAG: GTP-binding protein [Promethearchaeati archaeon SRVP18_Atabeyarchaeia-1]
MSCEKKAATYKIFVAGPFHAGKTTFVHFLDKNAQSVERTLADGTTTTIVFDLGHVWWNGNDKLCSDDEIKNDNIGSDIFRVMLMGSPGQVHMSPIREATSKGAQGVIFIVDSTAPGQIGHAIAIYEEVKSYLGKDIPMVVVANKQDLESAMKAGAMKSLMKIESVQFFEGSALTGRGIREALLALLKVMKERGLIGS